MAERTLEPYSSDLTDAEWAILEPLVPGAAKLGRPPKYEKRAILNGIFYVVRSGCSWRDLPHDLPSWRICYHYFARWREDGVWLDLHEALRDALRVQSGKKKPRPLRYSTRRACEVLLTLEGAAMMQARRCWDESDTWPWTPTASSLVSSSPRRM